MVYLGTGTSMTITTLNASTTYHIRGFELNVPNKYNTNTATGNPTSGTTSDIPTPGTDLIARVLESGYILNDNNSRIISG